MAPSDEEQEGKRGQRPGARRKPPPEGETLDTLLDGAARACRERGRADTAQALQRLRKKGEDGGHEAPPTGEEDKE